MGSLREAGLGPIVGHTTEKSCKVWIRAKDSKGNKGELSALQRTIGVAAVVAKEGKAIDLPKIQAFYFRLHRERDRTGVFFAGEHVCLSGKKCTPLKPSTGYTVRVGTLSVDDPFGDDENIESADVAARLPDPNVWIKDLLSLRPKFAEARFRTFSGARGESDESLAFVLGSCRYPGVMWKIKDADRIFGPMAQEATKGYPKDKKIKERRPVDFALMVGDQIYADMLNRHVPVGLADTAQEFQERYLTAFGSRKMRKLLRNLPTYMILDDHEIEDNWHQDRIKKAESRKVFNLAIDAYKSYQWSHCPDSFRGRLYYQFECGGYPFFVLDTRTQRYMDDVKDDLNDNHLLGRPSLGDEEPSQLERLLKWLVDCQTERGNTPKFVVSSSVFAPNPMSARTGRKGSGEQKVEWAEGSDSWPAFPETRKAILDTILTKKIQNVVFLSGDIHCANVAQLSFAGTPGAAKLKAYSITSSAFYWPFWFADGEPSNFVHDSAQAKQKDTFKISGQKTMDYKAWNFTQEDNFCRVDVDRESHKITIMPFDKDGNLIHSRDWIGKPKDALTSTLNLEPW
ncbi:alkaline phosphatase D family protein [Pelagibius sp. Alg239-R121]|uniref:alkaline phosphatase D family protein n=1 Tax=Pelagibius sp. Alg239-R121 TaxID=2993448 RepID=UPI0024A6D245|nr:alkaline phosphatase D family protein [Pelagibius sp. Alg239-R121]